jgi:hypothetical protein
MINTIFKKVGMITCHSLSYSETFAEEIQPCGEKTFRRANCILKNFSPREKVFEFLLRRQLIV